MRNETEVIQTVLNFAENNEMIRAALLNGSRANPNVARDIFCDYDIGLYGTDPDHFWHDRSWIQQFGVEIAHNLGYSYPLQDDQRVTAYLRRVSQLPKDASTLN